MYVHFTHTVRVLLTPVAQPIVHARRLLDLGLFPLPAGSLGPRGDPSPRKYILNMLYVLANTCCPTHSPRAASPGPWTPPLPRRLVRTPRRPPSMYVRFMEVVRGSLIPVAHPTVRARCLQDLELIPLLAGLFGPRDDPSPCTYVLQVVYTPC
jgi:hypothetical protein